MFGKVSSNKDCFIIINLVYSSSLYSVIGYYRYQTTMHFDSWVTRIYLNYNLLE